MRLFFLAAILLLAACAGEPPPKVSRGDTAPAFETARLDGTPVRFPADFAGHPVVVRFWADWCKYCEGERRASSRSTSAPRLRHS
jgi:thiol-disulfide isomerase/thioredoxin